MVNYNEFSLEQLDEQLLIIRKKGRFVVRVGYAAGSLGFLSSLYTFVTGSYILFVFTFLSCVAVLWSTENLRKAVEGNTND